MNWRRVAPAFLALAGTAFFLWLALRRVEFHALGRALAGARWAWTIPMVAIALLDLLVRALRWRVLLSRARAEPVPVWTLLKLEAIGLAVNNVLFLRLGELARAMLAARSLSLPALAALASVAVERALDVAALLTIFLIADRLAPGFAPPAVTLAAAILLACAVSALVVLALAEGALAEGAWAEKLLRRWPKLHRLVEQLALGAAVLRSPVAAAQAAGWSLLLWTVDAGMYWACARALGLGSLLDFPRAVLALSWAASSSALPAAPGAIGAFEAVVAAILMKFGAEAGAALAYALVCHMVMYLTVTLVGLAFLSREGLSLASLREEVAKR